MYRTLKADGCFILTDYFASSNEEELRFRDELGRLKSEQGIADRAFYHYDTPLTVEHETQVLQEAGFRVVEVLDHWGATYTLRANK